MLKKQKNLKLALLGMAILLPSLFGIVCSRLNFIPRDSVDPQVFGTALLPARLAATPGILLFAIALICAMVIITAILTGIALTKRMSNRVTNK